MSEHPIDYSEYFAETMFLKERLGIEIRKTIVCFVKAFLYTVLFICFYMILESSKSLYKGFFFAVCFWGYLHALIMAAVWLLRNILFPFADGITGSTGFFIGCFGSVLFFVGGTLLIIFLVSIVGGAILMALEYLFNFVSWISSPIVRFKLMVTTGIVLAIVSFIWYWGRMVYCAINISKKKKALDDLKKVYEDTYF